MIERETDWVEFRDEVAKKEKFINLLVNSMSSLQLVLST